jgi:hypothetical protein
LNEQHINFFLRDFLQKLEETEENKRQTTEKAEGRTKELAHHTEAFVENLDRDQLFNAMFENDTDGKALLTLGDVATDVYNKYPFSNHERSNSGLL